MRDIQSMIASVDELIQKNAEQLRLLRQMREVFILAQRTGVDPSEIERAGYNPSLVSAHKRGPDYVVLRDGRKVPLS